MVDEQDLAQTWESAQNHWTKERLKKLVHNKSLILLPTEGAKILRVMGLMNRDGSISATHTKKFLQVNHLLQLLKNALDQLANEHKVVRVLDACCGNSFVALLIAWYMKDVLKKDAFIVGIDRNAAFIKQSVERAQALGYSEWVQFEVADLYPRGVEPLPRESRFHLSVALHACDVASDYALARAVRDMSDVIAIAPCCQRELAHQWSGRGGEDHPLSPIFSTAQLRREMAATMTDAMRILLLRSYGYEVSATEFIPSAHTPKNRLILGYRRGLYDQKAYQKYLALKSSLGAGTTITLEGLLTDLGVTAKLTSGLNHM